MRVRNALIIKAHYDHLKNYARELESQVRLRTKELTASQLELIHCLGRVAEYRDNETGRHVIRVGCYAGIIGRQLGLDENLVDLIQCAAPLHDIGKVGIPDSILLKPGKLTPGGVRGHRETSPFRQAYFRTDVARRVEDVEIPHISGRIDAGP